MSLTREYILKYRRNKYLTQREQIDALLAEGLALAKYMDGEEIDKEVLTKNMREWIRQVNQYMQSIRP